MNMDTFKKTPQNPRILPAEGICNLRELGGYPVRDKGGIKRIKWGLLFRAGELAGMTCNDKKLLEERKVRTVVDFRSNSEREASPDGVIKTVRKQVALPIDAGNLMNSMAFTSGGAEAEMGKLYAALPKEAVPRYRALFELLSDPSNTPLLYHCTAGKDRTGLASALILYALGADTETVYRDYLESTPLLRERFAVLLESQPHMVPYMTVQESYLKTAWGELEKYGGPGRYIQKELNADIHHLRSLYIE
ncbi:MAG: tyrosine-protein phosphatase [Treponema sp.]|jgi:protein-tyrosine phosphatase|nr:tyrosine-protein phosphatase [Treponema sp.]